jgi:hypothetical protein
MLRLTLLEVRSSTELSGQAAGNGDNHFREAVFMFANPAASWYQTNRHNAGSACEHCGGIVRHERWCITVDTAVQYAYEVLENPEKLSLIDRLTLHALGVAWANQLALEK